MRKRIGKAERDACWNRFEAMIATGVFVETPIPGVALHAKARELSDRYTPTLAARSRDLLHVAAAALLGAKVFCSFDDGSGKSRRAKA